MLNIDYAFVKPNDVVLVREIEEYYNTIQMLGDRVPDKERYKCFMVFAFNLIECGLLKHAVNILDNDIDPSYYGKDLLSHIDDSVNHLQRTEDLKNKIDERSKQERIVSSQEVEYIYVLNGMLRHIPYLDFKFKKEFIDFTETFTGKNWEVKIRPTIGLVKD